MIPDASLTMTLQNAGCSGENQCCCFCFNFVARLEKFEKAGRRLAMPCCVCGQAENFANLGDIVIRASSCVVVFKTAVLQAPAPRNTPYDVPHMALFGYLLNLKKARASSSLWRMMGRLNKLA